MRGLQSGSKGLYVWAFWGGGGGAGGGWEWHRSHCGWRWSSPGIPLSLQRDVLHLYRAALRVATEKGGPNRKELIDYARAEMEK